MGLAFAELSACFMLAAVNAWAPAYLVYSPAGAVTLAGGLYLLATSAGALAGALSPASLRALLSRCAGDA